MPTTADKSAITLQRAAEKTVRFAPTLACIFLFAVYSTHLRSSKKQLTELSSNLTDTKTELQNLRGDLESSQQEVAKLRSARDVNEIAAQNVDPTTRLIALAGKLENEMRDEHGEFRGSIEASIFKATDSQVRLVRATLGKVLFDGDDIPYVKKAIDSLPGVTGSLDGTFNSDAKAREAILAAANRVADLRRQLLEARNAGRPEEHEIILSRLSRAAEAQVSLLEQSEQVFARMFHRDEAGQDVVLKPGLLLEDSVKGVLLAAEDCCRQSRATFVLLVAAIGMEQCTSLTGRFYDSQENIYKMLSSVAGSLETVQEFASAALTVRGFSLSVLRRTTDLISTRQLVLAAL